MVFEHFFINVFSTAITAKKTVTNTTEECHCCLKLHRCCMNGAEPASWVQTPVPSVWHAVGGMLWQMLLILPEGKLMSSIQENTSPVKLEREKNSLSNFLAKGTGPNWWLITVMDEWTSLKAALITTDYKHAKYLYSVHNYEPYCTEMFVSIPGRLCKYKW